MRKVALFVEDFGHEVVLNSLVQRIALLHQFMVETKSYSVRGGRGKVMTELEQYIRDVQRGRENIPDLLIVCTDANCRGFFERKKDIDRVVVDKFMAPVVCAIPDPHLERWLLLDSSAFKEVLGKGCPAPDLKCERDRYKRLLLQAILDAGVTPLLGGIEHAEALVNAMNLEYLQHADDSLGRLLRALHEQFRAWEIRDRLAQ